jgi:YjjG family noncanonical pyrimidine nucleotidase
MRYDCLLLDADGTLLDCDSAEGGALQATFEQFKISYHADYLDIYREINTQLWREIEQGIFSEQALPEERFVRLSAALELDLDPAPFGCAYLQQLALRGESLPQADEILAALHGRVRMVLVTNGLMMVQRSRLQRATITRYLDAIVISGEEGVAKPHPHVFDVALERAGNPPRERVLMVGDSLTADIAGGNNAGIDTCWINPGGLPRDPRYTPTYEIRELAELVPLVLGES